MPRLLLPLPLLLTLLLAACGGDDNGDADTTAPSHPPTSPATSPTGPPSPNPSSKSSTSTSLSRATSKGPPTPTPGSPPPQHHLAFDRLTLAAGPFEGPARSIQVFPTGSSDPLARTLYQLPRTQPLRDQFIGGHGFTGLVFVQDPTSGAEIQYFCSLAVPD